MHADLRLAAQVRTGGFAGGATVAERERRGAMRSLGRIAAAALAAASLAACTSANQRVAHADFGTTKALATTGSLRLITERERPGYQPVVCSEPSPDYAIAFGSATKAALAVNGGTPPAEATAAAAEAAAAGAVGSGAAAFDRTTTEAVTAGAGRAAAVLALRDGLYAACQSYANGVIGQDAYAVILSQYGHLLVALVGDGRADTTTPAGGKAAIEASKLDTRRTTLSTLIVACVSGHDATRLGRGTNRLLGPRFCQDVLKAALRQATSRAPA